MQECGRGFDVLTVGLFDLHMVAFAGRVCQLAVASRANLWNRKRQNAMQYNKI